jgi:hypothetical protein
MSCIRPLRFAIASIVVGLVGAAPATAQLVITPTFTSNFDTFFGANATAAQNAWIAAANVYSSNFTNNIQINITVDAVAGTSVFGQSNTSFTPLPSYSNLYNLMVARAKSADSLTSVGAGGSMVSTDPVSGSSDPVTGTHAWWVTRAQAKAIGLISSDSNNDGKTTFGAGNPFTFSGPIASGTYDFQGVCAHEISEVLGRNGLSGNTLGSNPAYSLIDNFSYKAPGTKGLVGGSGNNFSIDNGTTLLKLFNNPSSSGPDSRDWATLTPHVNDSFNQFADPGVLNPVTDVDLRLMDVIGYDRAPVPEPAGILALAFVTGGVLRWRVLARKSIRATPPDVQN